MSNKSEMRSPLKTGRFINPSLEHLVAEYLDCRETLEIFASRAPSEDLEKQKIIELSRKKLDDLQEAITPSKRLQTKKIFTAWRLVHRIGEDLILLMTRPELAAQGRKTIHDLKTSSLPETVKMEWLAKVEERQKILDDCRGSVPGEELQCAAQLLKTVKNLINDTVDDRFWDIWSRKLMALIYTVLLILGGILFYVLYTRPSGFSLCIGSIMLMGALGGVASGILTGEQEYLAKGHFWVSICYYPLLRPAQGALAAVVMFWMIQSQYLIKIDPPLEEKNAAFACLSSSRNVPPVPVQGRQMVKESIKRPFENVSTHKKSSDSNGSQLPLIALQAPAGKQIYLYMLVLLLAGFTGDKLLKVISDKVMSRLFAEAEKTKETKQKL